MQLCTLTVYKYVPNKGLGEGVGKHCGHPTATIMYKRGGTTMMFKCASARRAKPGTGWRFLLYTCMQGTDSRGLYKAEMGATILAMALCKVHKAKANIDITYQASATFTLNGRDGYNKPGYNPAHI